MDELTYVPGDSPMSLRIIGLLFGLAMIISVFILVRGGRIKEKYSLLWFGVGGVILFVSLFRDFMDDFSHAIGIYYAPSAFFLILIFFLYLLLINIHISISAAKKNNKSLIQEIGLLKLKVEQLERELAEKKEDRGEQT